MRIRSVERIEPSTMTLVRIWDTRVSGPSEEGVRRKAGQLPLWDVETRPKMAELTYIFQYALCGKRAYFIHEGRH